MSRLPGENYKKKLFYFFRVNALCIFCVALCKFGHQKFVITITASSLRFGQLIEVCE